MERAEKVGLGVATAGHVLLFGALSLGFLDTPNPMKLKQTPVEVSLVTDVGLESAAPKATEAPSQRISPEEGEPVDAAPPSPAPDPEPRPEPAPPKPQPAPAPKPEPKPQPKPAPEKAAPKPKPAPAPKPEPKAAPKKEKPAREAADKKTEKKADAPAKSASRSSSSKAAPTSKTGTGAKADAKADRPRGGRLGDNFLKGLTAEKSNTRDSDAAPSAAKIDGRALASIRDAIARQIQPCADRQVDPGPGANNIITTLNLRLNRDGTLSATPTVVRQTGIDDDNQRYARRVIDLGVAAFKGCSPLKLPAEFYATANGGWSNINYNWKLR